jgi:hypothetical protein
MKFSIRDLLWLTIVCALGTSLVVQSYQHRTREVHLRAALQAMKDFREVVEHKGWIEVKASSSNTGPATYTIQVDAP